MRFRELQPPDRSPSLERRLVVSRKLLTDRGLEEREHHNMKPL